MLETRFFVSWYIHNKEKNEWNATIVDQYGSLEAAKKAYHTQLGMYIDDPQFDSVAVILTNSYGGPEMHECWQETQPEPTPEA